MRIGRSEAGTAAFRRPGWILLLASIIAGCTETTGPKFEPQPVVFAIIVSGDSVQTVLVDQTYAIDDSVTRKGVAGASVTVFGNGDSLSFEPAPDTEGVYTARVDTGWFLPNTDYILRAIVPLEPRTESTPTDTVWATTTVPSRFRVTGRGDLDTLDRDSLPVLTWTSSAGREYYHLWIFPQTDSAHLDSLPFYYRIPQSLTDTVLDLATLRTYFAWHDTTYVFRVMASEVNYYHYLRQDAGPNLSQGFGVFGAFAVDSVKVYVK